MTHRGRQGSTTGSGGIHSYSRPSLAAHSLNASITGEGPTVFTVKLRHASPGSNLCAVLMGLGFLDCLNGRLCGPDCFLCGLVGSFSVY